MIRMFMMMMMCLTMSLRENGTRHWALPTFQQHKPWLKTFFPAPALSTTPRQRIKYFTFLFFIYFMKCIIINSTPSQGKIGLLLIRQTSNIRSLSDFKHGNLSLTGCKLFFDYRSETGFLQSDNSTLTSLSQNGETIFKDRIVSQFLNGFPPSRPLKILNLNKQYGSYERIVFNTTFRFS